MYGEQERTPYLNEAVFDLISEMPSDTIIHLDDYMDNIVLAVKKDSDFDAMRNKIIMDTTLKDEFNLVTVDFQVDGRSIASTSDIHVNDLESVLRDIKDGDTSYLIDETRTLEEISRSIDVPER